MKVLDRTPGYRLTEPTNRDLVTVNGLVGYLAYDSYGSGSLEDVKATTPAGSTVTLVTEAGRISVPLNQLRRV